MKHDSFIIGNIKISPPTVLAPLAGITNLPFRSMVKGKRCGLVCSEMVSANGLVYGSDKTFRMLRMSDEERPLSVQIFGSDPAMMAQAALMVQDAGADILDINFGCSVKKVIKSFAGVALMREPKRSERILTAVREVITIPLTLKMRTGWDPSGKEAFELASIAEHCGVDALCLHPRTARQGFSGTAHWPLIAAIKKHVAIPVIGNGDIVTAERALAMKRETGCDGVMIGRAALHDPDIFRRTALLFTGKPYGPVALSVHFAMIERYLDDMVSYHGENVACKMLRGRLGALIKGFHGSSSFRKSISEVSTRKEALALVRRFHRSLEEMVNNESG